MPYRLFKPVEYKSSFGTVFERWSTKQDENVDKFIKNKFVGM